MRTNVVLDESLVEKAKALTGIKTTRVVLDEALRLLTQLREQGQVRDLRGQSLGKAIWPSCVKHAWAPTMGPQQVRPRIWSSNPNYTAASSRPQTITRSVLTGYSLKRSGGTVGVGSPKDFGGEPDLPAAPCRT